MATTKHKQNGNQTSTEALQLTINTSLLEVGKQLNEYGKANINEQHAKEAKEKAKKELDKLIHVLFKAKVAIGNLPRGVETGDFDSNKLSSTVKIAVDLYLAMKDVSHNVRRNYISSLRVCIKEDKKFSLNVAREKAREKAKEVKASDTKASDTKASDTKASNTKAGDVKTPLDEVIRRNFKTLLDNNPIVARKLIGQLAAMAHIDLGDGALFDFEDDDYDDYDIEGE